MLGLIGLKSTILSAHYPIPRYIQGVGGLGRCTKTSEEFIIKDRPSMTNGRKHRYRGVLHSSLQAGGPLGVSSGVFVIRNNACLCGQPL